MRLVILGSAAGGGLPQWNCACPNCLAARRGALEERMQASVAASVDGERWVLLNASPDVRRQINATPALHPSAGRRSPLAAVVLTSADIDCLAGLLTLREGHAFELWATAPVLEVIEGDRVFRCLPPDRVSRRAMRPGESFEAAGLRITPIAAPGKPPFYLQDVSKPRPGDVVALQLTGDGARALFAPSCVQLTDELANCAAEADLVLFDGTFWRDDELVAAGYGPRTGRRMGHSALSEDEGPHAVAAAVARGRRMLIHVNNTNPVLDPDSPERRLLATAGWELAEDGMEIEL